jgi:hypothetical protein
MMKRNVGLKPRKSRCLPPEKLEEILKKTFPNADTAEIMKDLGADVGENTDE